MPITELIPSIVLLSSLFGFACGAIFVISFVTSIALNKN